MLKSLCLVLGTVTIPTLSQIAPRSLLGDVAIEGACQVAMTAAKWLKIGLIIGTATLCDRFKECCNENGFLVPCSVPCDSVVMLSGASMPDEFDWSTVTHMSNVQWLQIRPSTPCDQVQQTIYATVQECWFPIQGSFQAFRLQQG